MRRSITRRLLSATLAVAGIAAVVPGTAVAEDCGRDYIDAHGALWEVDSNGEFDESANDAYDGYGDLTVIVGADATSYQPTDDQACGYEDGDRETAYPSEASSGGLQVARKVYVPATGLRFGRILDIVSNPTAAAITARLEFSGNYGTDGDTLVLATSSGNTVVGVGDAWAAVDESDGEDSKIASLWDSAHIAKADAADEFPAGPASETAPGAGDGNDDVIVAYDNVTIGPGQTVIYMHVEHTTEGRPVPFART